MAHDPITDPEARTGTVETPQAGGISMSWDAVRGYRALAAIALVVGGFVWVLSAQAGQVKSNTDAVQKLDCLPVQVARVEEKVNALGVQLGTQQDTLSAILTAAQKEKVD